MHSAVAQQVLGLSCAILKSAGLVPKGLIRECVWQKREPKKQQSYTDVLHTAKALRAELQGNLAQYRSRNASLEKQAALLESRLQKGPPTLEAANALEAAKTQVMFPLPLQQALQPCM